MKKILGTFVNFFIITIMIFPLIMAINTNNDNSMPYLVENQINQKLSTINDLKYFDITKFTNTSHWVNVTREIIANKHAYTTSLTTILLYNNITDEINTLDFTVPTHEYKDTKHFEVYSENGTIDVSSPVEHNDTTTLTIEFPTVEYKESIEIVISMDHPNAIISEDGAILDDTEFPFQFNLSFIPLISLPITKYELEWVIDEAIEANIENDSINPAENTYTGSITVNDYGFEMKNITELASINRSLLVSSEYGNYNLSNLQNRGFIPAYNFNLKENLTSFLTLNYFHHGGTKIEFTKLSTTVTVTEYGIMTTEHEFTVKNNGLKSGNVLSTALGGPTFPHFTIKLPEKSYDFSIFDKYGNVSTQTSIDTTSNLMYLDITPRIQIEQGAEYNLALSYREKTKDIAKDIGSGKVELQIPLSMNFDWIVKSFEFSLLLPWGSDFSNQNILGIIENTTSRTSLSISQVTNRGLLGLFNKNGPKVIFNEFTPLNNKEVTITFGLSPFYLLQTPLSICFLIFILGFSYTIIRNISFGFKRKITSLEEIPLDLIKDFVKTYEEKTAIREQMLRLDRKRKSRNINSREYEKTKMLLKNRQLRADQSIVTASKKLGEEGPRYRVSMRSIEVAEANREDILKNIDSLERKKNQGRIGKEAYAKLKVSYNKQLRKANNEIDKVLIDLRSLLTK